MRIQSVPLDGFRLRSAREQAGMGRHDLASVSGVSVDMIRKLETGKQRSEKIQSLTTGRTIVTRAARNTSPETLAAFAEATGVRSEWLQGDGKWIRIDSTGKVTEDRDGLTAEMDRKAAEKGERLMAAISGTRQILKAAGYSLRWTDPEDPYGPSLEVIRSDGLHALAYPAELVSAVVRRGVQAVEDLFLDAPSLKEDPLAEILCD